MTNTVFIYMTHPLSLGIILILQTLLIAFFSGFLIPSFWYSYILVLVFLGGLLVLFIYVASLASNEQINIRPPHIIVILASLIILFTLTKFNPSKTQSLTDNQQDNITYVWIFSTPIVSASLFLIIYLFIVLVAVVKITKFWGGSLRPQSN